MSYTKTSDEHAQWVERLATMLRSNGVDARFDGWHLRPGMDVAQFMCNEIAMADRVVIISNAEYARRADGRVGGVGWETRLISGDLLTGSAGDQKYLVVARTRDLRSGVPMFLKSTLVIQWPDDTTDAHCRELLLRALHDKPAAEPPLLPPPLYRRSRHRVSLPFNPASAAAGAPFSLPPVSHVPPSLTPVAEPRAVRTGSR